MLITKIAALKISFNLSPISAGLILNHIVQMPNLHVKHTPTVQRSTETGGIDNSFPRGCSMNEGYSPFIKQKELGLIHYVGGDGMWLGPSCSCVVCIDSVCEYHSP